MRSMMTKLTGGGLLVALALPTLAAAQTVPGPSFRSVIDLESVSGPTIAPDGRAIVYQVRGTEWKENRFDTELWLWREGGEPVQLTRATKGSSSRPRWSADGRWIGFLSDRDGAQQLCVIGPHGGESMQLTHRKGGVIDFAWSPVGLELALLVREAETKDDEERRSRYGEFAVEDQEYRQQHLWTLGFDPTTWTSDTTLGPKPVRLTGDSSYSVTDFAFSPDGRRIAFEHRPDPLVTSIGASDLAVVDLASRRVRALVRRPGTDGGPVWSPDGRWIAFTSSNGDTSSYFYRNARLMKVPAEGGELIRVAPDFDEQVSQLEWRADGLSFVAWQKTRRAVFRVDDASNAAVELPLPFARVLGRETSPDGRSWAILAQADSASLPEVYRSTGGTPERLTDFTGRIRTWNLGPSEVVSWRSRDGATIEGVLHKPADFDSTRKYPLLVVIHGGPTGIDYPTPVPFYVYPIPQWVAKGAIVLRPNYRGSAGYGERFRSLNVRNLGVGDLWDVMSGVDALVRRGFVDESRMGAMGWSQGGYISAFLTTNTSRFKAISVGAGISNWVTYYVATDIHPFTRQYLKATPWTDRAIYARTSPMSTIRQARTPTLIQHGEFDRRVPTQNALELFQGLQDQAVPAELIIYKGFGHGISKPKEQLAAVWHNWSWFAKYLWGEEVTLPLGSSTTAEPQ